MDWYIDLLFIGIGISSVDNFGGLAVDGAVGFTGKKQ